MDIPAAIFKSECLKLMDQVQKTRQPIIITKHGRPVAQLTPVPDGPQTLFGFMKNTLNSQGDLVARLKVDWSALSGDEDYLYAPKNPKRSRRK